MICANRLFQVVSAGFLVASAIAVACTSASTQFIDPTDIPSGGVTVNADGITCGGVPGDSADASVCYAAPSVSTYGCCVGPGTSAAGTCLQQEGGACPAQTGMVACNETADCFPDPTNGNLLPCCATVHASDAGNYLSAQCSTSTTTCATGLTQLCRTNKECPNDKCVIQKCADGQTYEMCGLSTSPDFPCTAVTATP